MDDRSFQLTIQVPKPDRGWLRFSVRSLLAIVTVLWLRLALDGQLLMPWSAESMRRQQFLQLGSFEYLGTPNCMQVVSALGPPDSTRYPGPGFADVCTWQESFGVPPFASEYKLVVCFSSGGEVVAGGLTVNDERADQ